MKKINDAGFGALAGLLCIVTLCVIGAAGWTVYVHTKSPTKNGSNQKQSQGSYDALYAQIKNNITQIPNVTVVSNSWAAQIGSGAVLTMSGYDFSISSEMFAGLRIGATDAYNPQPGQEDLSSRVSDVVDSVMAQTGYAVSSKKYGATGYAPGDKILPADSPIAIYVKGANTCVNSYTSGSATFSCFTQNDVMNALENAKPFVAAYLEANSSIADQKIIFGPLTITSQDKAGVIGPSQSTGYDISEAVITTNDERKVALFYNKDSGSWTYVTEAMDEFGFSCDVYASNPNVSKALYGKVCLGTSGQIHFGIGTKATQ